MRLPHKTIDSIAFTANHSSEVIAALGSKCAQDEEEEINRLIRSDLPPVTSRYALAVMTGFNPGLIWSLTERPEKYYRVFEIPKGRRSRQIEAPKVTLKLIQKWLSIHFEKKWVPKDAVHGFVRGRSHISAAQAHLGARWVVSVDIANFFPSTPETEVAKALGCLGYDTDLSLRLLLKLCCYNDRLAQGAPTSPVLSNIALHPIDERIEKLALSYSAIYTRYADDIVLSGKGRAPAELIDSLRNVFRNTPWSLSGRKQEVLEFPRRLKVHGLLVHGERVRLTKRYRNRIRAYRHLYEVGKIREEDGHRIRGHLSYATQVDVQESRLR